MDFKDQGLNLGLRQLYTSTWSDLQKQYDEVNANDAYTDKPTTPLLLQVGNEESYKKADIRIMFFGQETNGWYEEDDEMEGILQAYNNFFNSHYCFKYGGQFWNGVSRFLHLFKKEVPDQEISFLWNNVVKIGRSEGRGLPPPYVYDMEHKYFPVISKELKILKPDLVLFLSGPNYDHIIEQSLGKTEKKTVQSFSQRQLVKIKTADLPLSYRTYHPNYLWRNGIDDYFNAIINDFKTSLKN